MPSIKPIMAVEKVRKTINGETAGFLERLFVLLFVPAILGIAGWVLISVSNIQAFGPRLDLLEEGFMLLNKDRIDNPRHSARDDAAAMERHEREIDRRLREIQRIIERHVDSDEHDHLD